MTPALAQARALARRSFVRLWESRVMTPAEACCWLRRKLDVETVDELDIDGCATLVRACVAFWAERCALRCPTCDVPVRQDHAHAIVGRQLFHMNCIPRAA